MRVLLINPITIWKNDQNIEFLKNKNFNDHLGIRYIASNLESYGHTVDLIDGHLDELSFEEILQKVESSDYDFYGISFVESIVEKVFVLTEAIKNKNPNSKTFLGGYGATLLWDKFYSSRDDIDAIFFGEGEYSVAEYINRIEKGEDWKAINGIIYKENGEIIKNPVPNLVKDLDGLIWPKREEHYKYGKANIIASRGCYGTCTYCSIVEFYKNCNGPRVRVRKPEKVVEEMEYLVKNCGVHHFDFVDDNFMITCSNNKKWAEEFVSEIDRRNLKVSFGIQARANDVKEEVLEILYRGGLRFVSVGIENDVDRIIKLFKTKTTKEIHRKAVEILKKLDINMFIEMIIFEPTTTLEELLENVEFLKEIKYWELFTQNPLSFSTKLHLYQKTPVIKDIQDIVEVEENGLHLSYKYKDERVKLLDEYINRWQTMIQELNTLHNGNIFYEASRQKKYGQGLKAIHLSKKYLKKDLDFFEELINVIRENSKEDVKELLEKVLNKYKGIMDEIYHKYNDNYKKIYNI